MGRNALNVFGNSLGIAALKNVLRFLAFERFDHNANTISSR
jgi:hypothetical protein